VRGLILSVVQSPVRMSIGAYINHLALIRTASFTL